MIYDPTEFRVKGIHLDAAIPFPAIALSLSAVILFMIFVWGRHQLGTISRAGLGAGAIGLAVYGGVATLTVLAF